MMIISTTRIIVPQAHRTVCGMCQGGGGGTWQKLNTLLRLGSELKKEEERIRRRDIKYIINQFELENPFLVL